MVSKERAKVQVKRRPPTRQARRAAASASASDETLFGSAIGGESAPVPQPAITSMDDSFVSKIQVDALPDLPDVGSMHRKETKDSDMSDEFFGFASSKSTREETVSKPKSSDLFSSNTGKTSVLNDNDDLFGPLGNETASKPPSNDREIQKKPSNKTTDDDFDLFGGGSKKPETTGASKGTGESKPAEAAKPPVVEGKSKKSLFDNADDDLFGSGLSGTKEKVRSPLDDDDLFASTTRKVEKPEKKEEKKKISSPLDDDSLFSSGATEKATTKSPLDDDDLLSSSTTEAQKPKESKPKETKPNETKEKPSASPLGDDDLFGGPVVKSSEDKEKTKETKKKEAEEPAPSKSKKILDVSTK